MFFFYYLQIKAQDMETIHTVLMDEYSHKQLLSLYGHDVRKYIEAHEQLEAEFEEKRIHDDFMILRNEADKRDYRQLVLRLDPKILELFALSGQSEDAAVGGKSKRNFIGIQGFSKVKDCTLTTRELESLVKKHDHSWLLKDILLLIKRHPRLMEPMINRKFKPNNGKSTPFYLRILEFGERSSDGAINVVMGDQTHKVCCVFPRKTVLRHMSRGKLMMGMFGLDNGFVAHAIYNFVLVKRARLRFEERSYIRDHFNLPKISSKLKYCVIEILDFEYVASVKAALQRKLPNFCSKDVKQNYNKALENAKQTDLESDEELEADEEPLPDAELDFDKHDCKYVYNIDLYVRYCRQ